VTATGVQFAPPAPAEGRDWIGPVFACLFVLSVLKGIRMPNLWSMTHYLFTYETGFMKRALWGELLRQLFGARTASYFLLAGIALAVFAALMLLVWWACRRLPVTGDTIRFLLIFAASPALAFVVHLVGYPEHLAYLAVMVALLLRRRWRLEVAWLLVAAAALPFVHEASLLFVGALVALVVITGQASLSARVVALALIAGVWTASTITVLQAGRVSDMRADTLRRDAEAFAHFSPRADAFAALRRPLSALRWNMQFRWRNPARRREALASIALFAPAALLLCAVAIRRARMLEDGAGVRAAAIALTMSAAASPLLLHVIALDQHRWNALAAFNVGLAAMILIDASRSATPGHSSGRGLATALIVTLWSIASHGMFFDNYEPRHPPFSSQIGFLLRAIQTPDRAMWIPLD
jgi:hypothetical protein